MILIPRSATHDPRTQSHKITFKEDKGEIQRLDNNEVFGVCLDEVYEIVEDQPLSAKVTIETNTRVSRKEAGSGHNGQLFDTLVNTKSVLTADETHFHSSCDAKAWSGNEVVFDHHWKKSIPRFNV